MRESCQSSTPNAFSMKHIEAHGSSVEHRTQLGESNEVPSGANTARGHSLDDQMVLVTVFQMFGCFRYNAAM